MLRPALCLVAGILLLAACGASDPYGPTEPTPTSAVPAPGPTTSVTSPPSTAVPPGAATPAPPASAPTQPTVALEPTVDLCTEALTVATDVELTFEEAAGHLEDLAARAAESALANELRGLAAGFRTGAAPSPDGLHALCP